MTLKIKRRSLIGWLMWLLLLFPFLLGTLNELLGLPHGIRYILDGAYLLLIFFALVQNRLHTAGTKPLLAWVLLFLACTLLVYLVQFQSPLYYLWGLRNDFRFYAAFLAFAVFMKPQDAEDYWKIWEKLFWLNAAVSLFQFFFLKLDGDNLGGLFGTEAGGNGYTNLFFLLVLSKSVVFCLEKKEKVGLCAAKCVTALLLAALAELKFFFVEFLLLLVLASLFTPFSWRKLRLLAVGFAACFALAALLTRLFPEFVGWFSFRWFLETALSAGGYTSSGDLNRLHAIPVIRELWLKSPGERLFGLGLGNCETSAFSFLNTAFFQKYGHMHYTWMSHAMMYLQCGWTGLVFYFGFFVLLFWRIGRIEKRSRGFAVSACRMAKIAALLCMLVSVYNSSLRTEAGYMVSFVLAIPFAFYRQELMHRQ